MAAQKAAKPAINQTVAETVDKRDIVCLKAFKFNDHHNVCLKAFWAAINH